MERAGHDACQTGRREASEGAMTAGSPLGSASGAAGQRVPPSGYCYTQKFSLGFKLPAAPGSCRHNILKVRGVFWEAQRAGVPCALG